MPDLTTCLWFDRQGEEAAEFYCSVFPDSGIDHVDRYPGGERAGEALTVAFRLDGKPFVALNGGPEFTFSEAVSVQIHTDGQAETDRYWNALLADGGEESMCGWLKDRYGFSWQVVPKQLPELLGSPDPEVSGRVMAAMMQMRKIDVAALEDAARG